MQGIYAIINNINGKAYVGQSVNIGKRWKEHEARAFKTNAPAYNYPIQQAIRKYGIDNFTFVVLEKVADARLLTEKEQYYFELLDGKNKLYNLAEPVSGFVSYLGKAVYKVDADTLEVVEEYPSTRAAARAIHLSSQALISVLQGEWNLCGGYYWCYVKDWYIGWKPSPPKTKQVELLDKNDNIIAVFKNQSEAAKQTGFSQPSISRACRGIQLTAYGYKWAFKEE